MEVLRVHLARMQRSITSTWGRSKRTLGTSILASIFILGMAISVLAQSPSPPPLSTPASASNKTLKIATRVLPLQSSTE
jgi:hypothetical protein